MVVRCLLALLGRLATPAAILVTPALRCTACLRAICVTCAAIPATFATLVWAAASWTHAISMTRAIPAAATHETPVILARCAPTHAIRASSSVRPSATRTSTTSVALLAAAHTLRLRRPARTTLVATTATLVVRQSAT